MPCGMNGLHLLSLFYSSKDPSLWDGAPSLQWVFTPQLNQVRNTLRDLPRFVFQVILKPVKLASEINHQSWICVLACSPLILCKFSISLWTKYVLSEITELWTKSTKYMTSDLSHGCSWWHDHPDGPSSAHCLWLADSVPCPTLACPKLSHHLFCFSCLGISSVG